MTSTYSPSLRIQEPATGDQNNTWGVTLNTNFNLIDTAIAGYQTINIAGLTTYTLTALQGVADQSRYPVYIFTGALTAACTVTIPQVSKYAWVINNTTGGFAVTLTTGIGTTFAFPADGYWRSMVCDGTNVTVPNVSAPGFLGLFTGTAAITSGTINGTHTGTFSGAATITSGTFAGQVTGSIACSADTPNTISFFNNNGLAVVQGNTVGALSAITTNINNTLGNHIVFEFQNVGSGSITSTAGIGSVQYNATSDYRIKTTYGLANAGAMIDAIPIYDAEFNDHPETRRPMLLAHELQAVMPSAVVGEKDAEKMQQVDYMALIPALLAEVQALRKRVAALGG